jgi:hypothetical protein
MSIEIPEPDMEVLRKLYYFGGLLVYRAAYFDPGVFKVVNGRPTFNEETAKAELALRTKEGFTAGMESFMVYFDGAFLKPNAELKGRGSAVAEGPL